MDSASVGSHPYQAVAAAIIETIKADRLPPDKRLPSVRQLAKEQGVSPVTAQKALNHLTETGYATVKAGLGYFAVDPAKQPAPAPTVEGLAREVEELRGLVGDLTKRLDRVEGRKPDQS